MKKVSVIIPTYGRPNFLSRAIDSVLRQTFSNIEVIVVDDNNPGSESRELTEITMQKYSENLNVKYIKHEKNRNGSAARNTGVKNSIGEYVCFLDDDDEYLPNKIASQLYVLENKDDDFQICYSNYIRKNESGKIIDKYGDCVEGNLHFDALKRNLFIQAGSNLMISRKAFLFLGGFDETFLRNQDLEFLVRATKFYKIAYCSELGLIVNLQSKRNDVSDHGELAKKFQQTFFEYINYFTDKEQKEIFKYHSLQVCRSYIEKKEYSKAFSYRKEHEVKWTELFSYLFYLIARKLKKRSYGYKKIKKF